MGKIIERVRAREAERKKRVRERDPLIEYYMAQQRAMQNTNQLSSLHYANQCANAYQVQWIGEHDSGAICRRKEPWWRFW